METDKPEQRRGSERAQPARLGGARADFVASLGRKVNDTRAVLAAVQAERGTAREKGPREELRRRLHAIGASARLLRFDEMARAIGEAEGLLDRAAQGALSDADMHAVAQVLDDLPALAWGEPPLREKAGNEPPPEKIEARSALVVGPAMLAEALTEDDESTYAAFFECERTDDAQAAIGLARALAPDVMLIDADVDAAPELVEALLDDPLTEPVPIVVVGAFKAPEHAARFVALGVAKALAKPITTEMLRRACEEAIDQRQGVTMRVTLGEPTLEQLGDRLAEEVRRALVESVDKTARGVRVPLGEGTEVLGAVWGAIARVREVVTTRTDGAVRFAGPGPEGAIAVAPWLQPDLPGTDRIATSYFGSVRGRGAAADVRLHGRRVVVADDDPGVTWFIADLLRTAGCVVHEALDGTAALDLCYRVAPELVVSDILMPGLDGFALARGLKRDVALRDTPVILLSWKEDLLQRVRELGASAAAYLRKESDSRAIVARVRECLRPRARVEARLRGDGEVRGRLDGLAVRSLLEIVCSIRPNARVSVRDASFLYEVEIRDGAPRKITRTAGDGSFVRGERILGGLLGASAGRFTVATSTASIASADFDLKGTLAQQALRPLATARAAMAVTTGARTMNVAQVALDVDAVEAYVAATPDPARSLVQKLADGASPRAMLLGGDCDPTLLEDVLADLAQRGAIVGARSQAGTDLFGTALDALLAAQEIPAKVSRSRPPPRVEARGEAVRVETGTASAGIAHGTLAHGTLAHGSLAHGSLAAGLAHTPAYGSVVTKGEAPIHETFTITDTPPPPPASSQPEMTPSSLADAVMRELSDGSADNEAISSIPPPIVAPGELKPRTNPPSVVERVAVPSLPPDAVVPDDAGATDIDAPVHLKESAPLRSIPIHVDTEEMESSAIRAAGGEMPGADTRDPEAGDGELRNAKLRDVAPSHGSLAPVAHEGEPSTRQRTPLTSVAARDRDVVPMQGPRWPYVAGIGGLAAAVAIAMAVASPGAPAAPAAAAAAAEEAPAPAMSGVPVASEPSGVIYADMPAGLDVPAGQGLLELTAPEGASIRVDGAPRGTGSKVRIPLTAGPHEVRVLEGERSTRVRMIEVRAGLAARVDLARTP